MYFSLASSDPSIHLVYWPGRCSMTAVSPSFPIWFQRTPRSWIVYILMRTLVHSVQWWWWNLPVWQQHHRCEAWFGEWGRLDWVLVGVMIGLGWSTTFRSNRPAQWHDKWIYFKNYHATNLADSSIQAAAFGLGHPSKYGVRRKAGRMYYEFHHIKQQKHILHLGAHIPDALQLSHQ